MKKMRNIDEYDMWFNESAGNKIRELLPMYYEVGAKGVFDSGILKANRNNIIHYKKSVETLEREDISVVTLDDKEYPALLREIFDPPYILYYVGRLPSESDLCCAVVGARKATNYGRTMAFRTGYALGLNGAVVVSGMAAGADSCAHSGCLEAGGRTVAVLGTGVDSGAKVTSRKLFDRIVEGGGCVMSEFAPGIPGMAQNYPKRNRIISGMSSAIVVTEAAKRSGTSITAGLALEQGRDVYAIPGNINSVMSEGTNKLIREGAIPLLSCESIAVELGLASEKMGRKRGGPLPEMGGDERAIYNVVKNFGQASVDVLAAETGKTQTEVNSILTILEIKGIISRKMGKITIAI